MAFLYGNWMRLPITTRHTIAANFGFVKKGPTEVSNNEIVRDGYMLNDIETHLTVGSIQTFLGTGETDSVRLWDMLVARVEGREIEPTVVVEEIVPIVAEIAPVPVEEPVAPVVETPVETPIKRRPGRPAKNK